MTRITKAQARAVMQGLTSAARDFRGTRVLWVVDEDDMNVMPEHPPSFVKVAVRLRGVSDHYYTRHEEVALTVSHCGLTAAQASLVNSKPVVCIPFFGDQFDIAVRVRESGAGVAVKREGEDTVGVADIYEAVAEVLENLEAFQTAAHAVSRRLLDAGGSLEALRLLDVVRTKKSECGVGWDRVGLGEVGEGREGDKRDGYIMNESNVKPTPSFPPSPHQRKPHQRAGTCFTTSTRTVWCLHLSASPRPSCPSL